jgi:hypothetical protein
MSFFQPARVKGWSAATQSNCFSAALCAGVLTAEADGPSTRVVRALISAAQEATAELLISGNL